jgi:hypothetical protein
MSLFTIFKGINNTPEMGRILWFLGGVSMIFFSGWAVIVNKEPFLPHALEFGGGFAALLAAGGFGINQKDTGVANAIASATPSINVDKMTGGITTENVNVGNSRS